MTGLSQSSTLLFCDDFSDAVPGQWTTNGADWRIHRYKGKTCFGLVSDTISGGEIGTRSRGRIAIVGDNHWTNYEAKLDLLIPPSDWPGEPGRAWVGVAFRVQDTGNYELFWFRPHAREEGKQAVDYLSVAHDIVAWWSFMNTNTGKFFFSTPVNVPLDEWFHVRVMVKDSEAALYIHDMREPALTVKCTYYHESGGLGLYCGTYSKGKFANVVVRSLDPSPPSER